MDVLNQLAEDIPRDDLRHVLAAFEEDMQRISQVLVVAAAAGDLVACHRAAHSLAGAASAVGAGAVEQGARAVMAAGDPTPLVAQAALIAGLVRETVVVLRRFVAGDTDAP